MLTDEQRKYILNEHLRNISHISNKEHQRRVWNGGEGPDFSEACCHFFDDGDPILRHYRDFWITDGQYQILKQFRDQFEAFADADDRPYLPEEFIDTPEWDEITKMAKEVLQAFHYGSDKSEGAAQP